MKLIVGLGNPDNKYQLTRHNFGWLAVNELTSNWTENKPWHCNVSKIDGAILCQPLTYMNNSGEAVKAVADYYKIAEQDIVVIHDDLDLEFGSLRLGVYSSSAGHNGIKSIQNLVGKEFIRIRLGIGKPINPQQEVADFVLEKFSAEQMATVKTITKKAADIATQLLTKSLTEVQNIYN